MKKRPKITNVVKQEKWSTEVREDHTHERMRARSRALAPARDSENQLAPVRSAMSFLQTHYLYLNIQCMHFVVVQQLSNTPTLVLIFYLYNCTPALFSSNIII